MEKHTELIRESIIRDISDGVMVIGFDGIITYLNKVAEQILGRSATELEGQSFAVNFFEYQENDAFNQMILDAAYDRNHTHEGVVSYFTGSRTLQLRVKTSFLYDGAERVGIIVVLSDISELAQLRDAVTAMKQIQELNNRLQLRNQLLSETFGRFLSDEIVRQLLDTPGGLALGGKKRTLTIMMSDLRGFTAISERMEAQSLLTMLNHYLGEMTEVIQRHSGTIIEFIGDGIMAIFGAPSPLKSHAADAVAAAVEMQARMEAVNAWNVERGYPVLEMGIGVNTGEMIVGNIGSEKRTKYGVVGNQVNLCGRIESYTVGGQVLISPKTREMISEPLTIEQEQTVYPKGVNGSLVLSQVSGIGGRYNVSCKGKQEETMQSFTKPVPVQLAAIHEKHMDAVGKNGVLLALSKTGAILQTEEAITLYENLQIRAEGELFAKVIGQTEQGWNLRFTATPPGFDTWYSETIKKGAAH